MKWPEAIFKAVEAIAFCAMITGIVWACAWCATIVEAP